MQDEIQGPDPEEMGLEPKDLSTEGVKPEPPQKNEKELSDLARKVFRDEPDIHLDEEALSGINREAKNILERYNFGPNLDDQFYGDITRLAGEKVDEKVDDIPSKLRAGHFTEKQLGEIQEERANKERWWIETAHRLQRERQDNPVDDRETVRVMVEMMRPPEVNEQYSRFTKAISDKASSLLERYRFNINPDVKFLEEIVDYSRSYEMSTNYEIYPHTFPSRENANRFKQSADEYEPEEMREIYQRFLERQGRNK